ncbi:hypothetical protein [Labilibacter marinus]|uniref:hypothetical protein n=1 Tax=Labilibacter marinus TaxID=1477105 RepID=UPI00094FC5C4|nr:hypothetical protein [Labilibacter marinus]
MKKLTYLLIALAFIACDEEGCDCVPPPPNAGNHVIISADEYKNTPADDLTIIDAVIYNDSIHIKYGASGCDGSSWLIALFDADEILESNPEQRNIRLAFKNEEMCDAYFTKEISFDIKALQIESDKIYLNLQGWDKQLLYDY